MLSSSSHFQVNTVPKHATIQAPQPNRTSAAASSSLASPTGASPPATKPSAAGPDDPGIIKVRVRADADDKGQLFKISMKTSMEKLIDAYMKSAEKKKAKGKGILAGSQDGATLRFTFDGMHVQANMTAEHLDLEDGDTIDVRVVYGYVHPRPQVVLAPPATVDLS